MNPAEAAVGTAAGVEPYFDIVIPWQNGAVTHVTEQHPIQHEGRNVVLCSLDKEAVNQDVLDRMWIVLKWSLQR